MEVKQQEALKAIRNGQLCSVYVLYGNEPVLIDEVRQAIVEASRDWDRYTFSSDDSVERGLEACKTPSLFAQQKLVFVTATCEALTQHARALERYFAAPFPGSRLVFSVPDQSLPSWLKSQQTDQVLLVNCSKLPTEQAMSWLSARARQAGKTLPNEVAEAILDACEKNLTWASAELEKLICYCGSNNQITMEDFKTVCSGAAPSVFKLVETVFRGKVADSLELCDRLLSLGESVEGLFGLLASEIRYMYKLKVWKQSGATDSQIVEALHIQPFRFSRCSKNSSRMSLDQLRETLLEFNRLDTMAKTGWVTFDQALRMAVLYLASKVHS
ncbi:MAG: DNA polymerase III subunit delta [Bacillota bacterium]